MNERQRLLLFIGAIVLVAMVLYCPWQHETQPFWFQDGFKLWGERGSAHVGYAWIAGDPMGRFPVAFGYTNWFSIDGRRLAWQCSALSAVLFIGLVFLRSPPQAPPAPTVVVDEHTPAPQSTIEERQ